MRMSFCAAILAAWLWTPLAHARPFDIRIDQHRRPRDGRACYRPVGIVIDCDNQICADPICAKHHGSAAVGIATITGFVSEPFLNQPRAGLSAYLAVQPSLAKLPAATAAE